MLRLGFSSLVFLCVACCVGKEEHCVGDDCFEEETDPHAYEKYHKPKENKTQRWQYYLQMIKEANAEYKECNGVKCYQKQKKDDFYHWIERGGIAKEEFQYAKLENLGEHYQIINHTLYRQSSCVFPARCSGNEHFILKIIHKLTDMELIINSHDWPKVRVTGIDAPVLSFSKTSRETDLLYPAWSFWEGGPAVWPIYPTGIGRWDLMRKDMRKAADEWPWEKKKPKAFFRGSRTSSERDPLVYLSWQESSLFDAHYTKNQAYKGKEDTLGDPPAEEIPLDKHCDHKYLFNFRGVAASFRLKFLFLCKSLVFHVGHEWIEFFYTALKPWVHYIPVSEKLTEVRELIDFAREHDDVVKEIALRGHDFIRKNLRMADVQDYWFQVLNRYAKLMKWKPERDYNLVEIKKRR